MAKAMKSGDLKGMMIASAAQAKVVPGMSLDIPQTELLMKALKLNINRLKEMKKYLVRLSHLTHQPLIPCHT